MIQGLKKSKAHCIKVNLVYKTITSQPGHQTGKDHSQKISIMVHAFKIEESLSGHPKTVKTFENCQEM